MAAASQGSLFAIDGEWRSELPDGREVVVRRHGVHWIVQCGSSYALADNLDVALAQAIHAETGSVGHARAVHYPTWIRDLADKIASDK
jgi:hypothetical protein